MMCVGTHVVDAQRPGLHSHADRLGQMDIFEGITKNIPHYKCVFLQNTGEMSWFTSIAPPL